MASKDNLAKAPDVADLPLILQDLLDRIEALRVADASGPVIGQLEVEYRELRGK